MKIAFLIAINIILMAFAVSCTRSGSGNYDPPQCVGSGTVYIFAAKNGFGTDIFHDSLNQFLSQHQELRLVSFTPIEHESGNPSKYMVIVVPIKEQPAPSVEK